MKKAIISILMVSILIFTGCSNQKEEKTMSCNRTLEQSGLSMDLTYNVSYVGSNVTKVESVEKVTSDNSTVLETYKTQIEKVYEPYKDIEYYDYSVNINDNTLTSKTNINYEKIDTDKMISVDSANSQLIKKGKINIDTLKSYYEALGITCKK